MSATSSGRIDDLVRGLGTEQADALPPIERWNPPDCGDIDIRIDRDGGWHHEGRPILRPALAKLFASVLKLEGERYVLVTPAEKVGIVVEDAPFLAVEMTVEAGEAGDALTFRTNMDDIVICGDAHPLRFHPQEDGSGPRPYLYVRRGLWARLTRPVYLELAERAEERHGMLGIASGAAFFPLMPVNDLDL